MENNSFNFQTTGMGGARQNHPSCGGCACARPNASSPNDYLKLYSNSGCPIITTVSEPGGRETIRRIVLLCRSWTWEPPSLITTGESDVWEPPGSALWRNTGPSPPEGAKDVFHSTVQTKLMRLTKGLSGQDKVGFLLVTKGHLPGCKWPY